MVLYGGGSDLVSGTGRHNVPTVEIMRVVNFQDEIWPIIDENLYRRLIV